MARGRHLEAHARLAEQLGVPEVIRARNGDMVRLAPAPAAIIDDVPVGRLYRDGAIITRAEDGQVRERRKLSFAGYGIGVAGAVGQGRAARRSGSCAVRAFPAPTANGTAFETIVREAAIGTIE